MRTVVIVLVCFFCSLFSAYAQPTSDFLINGTSPACVDQEVDFISLAFGGVVQWDWDFGDGSTSTAVNPSHTYTDVGTFAVTLVVTDGDGLIDSSMQNYIVRPPKADFVVNPAIGCTTPHTVFFTDQSTFPDTWSWNFGDGNTSTLQNPVHNYTAYGDFMASLTVSDTNFGCTDTIIIPIKVAGVTPDFTANGSTFGGFGCGPLEVGFEDTSIVSGADTIDTWLWDFGDGNTSTLQNPTHVYRNSGNYTVSLTTTLAITGCSNTETKPAFVTVIGPDVDFSSSDPTSGCPPLTVNFMDMTTFSAPIVAWDWDFGDGNTSNLINPTNIYTTEGLFDVSLTITDIDGCSRTETKMGYIDTRDTTPPIITCPSDQTELVDGNCEFVLPDYTGLATASDNCGSVTVSQSPIPGTIVASGTTIITLTASDGTNTNSCTFDVIVEDTIAPQANCVSPFIVQLDATGMASIDVNDIDNGSTDNCGIASSFLDITSFDCTHIGVNTVTLTVVDESGNSDFCTVQVTVEDSINPTAVCQDITIQLDATGNAFIIPSDVDGGSSDNCGINSSMIDIAAFDCTNIGTNNVVLTVSDASGNSDSCTAIVTVEDNVAPTVSCQDITISLDVSGNATIVPADINLGAFDACGIATTSIDIDTFNCSNIGLNNVTLFVTDVNGNTGSCIAVVIVEDNDPPVAVCQDITIQLDLNGVATILPSDVDGGSTDNCTMPSLTIDVDTFDCTNIGPNNVVFTVTDAGGNITSCVAVVTVEDNVAPSAVCQDITIQLDASGNAFIIPSDVDGGSTDACGINAFSIDIDTFDCSNLGANNVILTVVDANGNSATCIAVVTVEEQNAIPMAVCQNITVPLQADGTATIGASDINAGSSGMGCFNGLTIDIDTFDCSDVGTPVTVTLMVTNGNGDTDTCTAMVNVVDSLSPTIECANDISITENIPYTLPDYFDTGVVTAIDNCENQLVSTQVPVPGTQLQPGTYNITVSIADPSGNSDTCVVRLTVNDILNVEENTRLSSVVLFPNPASSFINIANPKGVSLQQISIVDMAGRIVKHMILDAGASSQKISVSQLASATYMVIITSEKGQLVQQLVKE